MNSNVFNKITHFINKRKLLLLFSLLGSSSVIFITSCAHNTKPTLSLLTNGSDPVEIEYGGKDLTININYRNGHSVLPNNPDDNE
jgi:hypothetical protein